MKEITYSPSPLMGEGRGEGEHGGVPPPLSPLPPREGTILYCFGNLDLVFGIYFGFWIWNLEFRIDHFSFIWLNAFSIPAASSGISSSKTVRISRINSSLLIREMMGGVPFLKLSSRLLTERSGD